MKYLPLILLSTLLTSCMVVCKHSYHTTEEEKEWCVEEYRFHRDHSKPLPLYKELKDKDTCASQ
jgi:hypothetical protein